MLARFASYFKIPMSVLEKVPANPSSDAFSICACNELTILCEHFFGNQGKIIIKKKMNSSMSGAISNLNWLQ